MNGVLLESVDPDRVTTTSPLVAPAGTVTLICVGETKVTAEGVPLNVTLSGVYRLFPRISTVEPTCPDAGKVFTNGTRPSDRL